MSATPLEADKKSHLPDDFEVQGGYSPSDGPSDGPQRQIQHDAVFGDLDEAGPNYRSVRLGPCAGPRGVGAEKARSDGSCLGSS